MSNVYFQILCKILCVFLESQCGRGPGGGRQVSFPLLQSISNCFVAEVPDQNGLNFKQIFILSSVRKTEAEIKASVFDL